MSAVLVLHGAADASAIRRALPDVLVHELPDLDSPPPSDTAVLVLRSGVRLGERELDALPRLRHVVRTGSGIDHIDVDALRHRGITLHRNAEAGAGAVGEWVLAASLALARRLPLGQHALLLGQHEKQACMGTSLGTMAAGIWGAGPVGLAADWALAPFMDRTAFAAWPSNPPGLRELSPTALMEQAQVHVIALPLRPTTEQLIGEDFLARVAPQRPLLICAGRLEPSTSPPACGRWRTGGSRASPSTRSSGSTCRSSPAPRRHSTSWPRPTSAPSAPTCAARSTDGPSISSGRSPLTTRF